MANSSKFGSAFLAVASCATFFSLTSCSDGGGGVNPTTETDVYTITEINSDYISVVEKEEWYECTENGLELETYDYPFRINYSITNNVLTTTNWGYDETSLIFNGNSNSIIGTWTRNKNKQESCRDRYYYEEYDGYWCDDYYDVVKAVVTNTQLAVIREVCATDKVKNGEERNGWRAKILDCNSFEVSKGKDKVIIYEDRSSAKITYNGKSCQIKEPSRSESESACQKAINECKSSSEYYCLEDYYYDFLDEDFDNCIKELDIPRDLDLRKKSLQPAGKAVLGKKLLPLR